MTTIALALGAGGARGLAHIHVFQAFDDLGVKPVSMAGTSIGSLMAAAYCAGMTGDEIHEYVQDRFNNRLRLIGDVLKTRPGNLQTFFADGGVRIGDLNLPRILDIFLPEQIPEDFSDLKIPLQVVATEYYGQCDRVFREGPLRSALAASAAIPAIFAPIQVDGDFLIDGGVTNPIPFEYLQGKADYIMAVDVTGGTYGDTAKRPGKIDVLYASSQIMQQSIARAKAVNCRIDKMFRPKVERFRVLDFLKTDTVLAETADLREDVKRTIDAWMSRPALAHVGGARHP